MFDVCVCVCVLLYQPNNLQVILSDAINAKCFQKLKSGLNEMFLVFLLFVRGRVSYLQNSLSRSAYAATFSGS